MLAMHAAMISPYRQTMHVCHTFRIVLSVVMGLSVSQSGMAYNGMAQQ